ncbi:RidA family protein [Agromyces sp. Marseille-P2726]|uniref:RidA family protein n=1 Tax=Agromyces sp. Marseille-P2726 TaxID=2709132 RepID=UPI00156DE996|nr:RidA family protein [Agromyces sp. Marseille-P2726]
MPRRTAIYLPGFGHANPIPVASRIGPHLVSGALTGRDPSTRELPPSLEEQCANVFAHVRALMEAAGGTPDDIIKMTVWLADPGDRQALNREWVAMFPDVDSRPARHVIPQVGGGALIQVDLTAVLAEPASG